MPNTSERLLSELSLGGHRAEAGWFVGAPGGPWLLGNVCLEGWDVWESIMNTRIGCPCSRVNTPPPTPIINGTPVVWTAFSPKPRMSKLKGSSCNLLGKL